MVAAGRPGLHLVFLPRRCDGGYLEGCREGLRR
jgi:hypothetical protein